MIKIEKHVYNEYIWECRMNIGIIKYFLSLETKLSFSRNVKPRDVEIYSLVWKMK